MGSVITLAVIAIVVIVLVKAGVIEVEKENGKITARVNWNS